MMNMNEEKMNKVSEVNESAMEQVVGGAGVTIGRCTIINCDHVNIRDMPGGGNVIGTIQCGKEATYIGNIRGWGHIIFRGVEGYIPQGYYTTE